jgi:hypothetical protein
VGKDPVALSEKRIREQPRTAHAIQLRHVKNLGAAAGVARDRSGG